MNFVNNIRIGQIRRVYGGVGLVVSVDACCAGMVYTGTGSPAEYIYVVFRHDVIKHGLQQCSRDIFDNERTWAAIARAYKNNTANKPADHYDELLWNAYHSEELFTKEQKLEYALTALI